MSDKPANLRVYMKPVGKPAGTRKRRQCGEVRIFVMKYRGIRREIPGGDVQADRLKAGT